jgi:hypothetical protein
MCQTRTWGELHDTNLGVFQRCQLIRVNVFDEEEKEEEMFGWQWQWQWPFYVRR